ILFLYTSYKCGDYFCGRAPAEELDLFPTPDPHYVKKYYFPVRALERALAFDMKGEDVIVFLHIQKTGGTTFGRHLVQNVRLEVPCDCRPGQKKCTCYRPNRRETWLFSRFSTGWSCGLHADWTELTSCVPGVLDKRESAALKGWINAGVLGAAAQGLSLRAAPWVGCGLRQFSLPQAGHMFLSLSTAAPAPLCLEPRAPACQCDPAAPTQGAFRETAPSASSAAPIG
uniref:Heparan-sulfate 6-O-sulfotransferase n=1 Tax=Chrysemys picta bellii TaxID=8478 RepID=A0A8C3P9Z8_CHRPI